MRYILSLLFIITTMGTTSADDSNPIPIADIQQRDAVNFDDEVLPIFQRNCLACHNEREPQGGLVLESPDSMRKGGDTGPALIPARGADSLLLRLASHQTDPVMPPIGNDVNAKPLTSHELGLIRLWIDQGARQSKSTAMLSPQSLKPISSRIAPVYSLDLTEDGQHLAVSRANQLYVYHVPTGRLVTHFHDPAINDASESSDATAIAHRDLIQSVAFNRDGDLLASGSFRETKLWRRPSDVTLLELKSTAAFTAVAVSPDRQIIATAIADNSLQIWDALSGKPIHLLKGHTDRVTTLKFTQSGQLVSASLDQSIRFWDTQQGIQTGIIETPAPVNAMELTAMAQRGDSESVSLSGEESANQLPPSSPTPSQEIVTGGPDKLVRTWAIPQGSPTRWPQTPEGLSQATFSHDKRLIAIGRNDGMIVVMHQGDDGNFKSLAQWKLPAGPSVATSFLALPADAPNSDSPDISSLPYLLTTATDGSVTVWSLTDQSPLSIWQPGTNEVTTIATSHDGKWLATGAKDGSISLWHQLTSESDSFDDLAGNAVTVAAKNPSNTRLAVAGISSGQPAIFVYDLEQGQLLQTLLGHSAPIRSIAYSSDNNRIISGGDDRTARVWNPLDAQKHEQHRIDGFSASVTAVAISPDGSHVVAGLADNSVGLWNLSDASLAQDFKGHTGTILGVGYTGNDLYSISADRTVRFWTPTDAAQTRSFNNQATTHACAVNHDGTLLALSSDDNNIRIFQTSGGQLLHTLDGHIGIPTSLAFSADNKKIVATVAANDRPGETTIWDLGSTPPRRQEVWREPEITVTLFGQPLDHLIVGDRSGRIGKKPLRFVRHLAGNTQPIKALAFHSNNQTLFTAAQDGSLRGYTISNGQQTFATSHGAAINTLTIAPNAQVLLTGGENAVVRLWQINGSPYGPQQIAGIGGPVQSLAISDDSSRVIVATAGEKPRSVVYELNTAAALQQSTLNQQPVIGLATLATSGHSDLAASPTSKASSSPESILSVSADAVWQWSTDSVRVLAGHSGEVNSIAAMPTEPRQIWSAGADNTLRLWNLENGQSIRQINHGGSVLGIAVRPDGQRIASVSENRTAKLWNINGQPIAEMRGDMRLKSQVARLTFQQTSGTALVNVSKQRLEAAQKDEPLKMQAEQKAAETLMAATKALADKQTALDKSSVEKLAAEQEAIQAAAAARVAGVAKTAADEAYKLAAAAVTSAQQRAGQLASIANAMPSDEAIKLAVADANQVVTSSQTTAQEMQKAMQGPTESLQAATATANTAAEKAATYQKPYNDLLAEIKVLATAKTLAVQQHEIAAREWNDSKDRIPRAQQALTDSESALQAVKQQLESASKTLADAEMPIRQVAFSPDGSVLVTAGDYRNAHVWDAETGAALAAYAGHEDAMTGVCFMDDDRFLSVSADRSLRVWQRNPPWKLEKTIGSVDQPELISHRVTSLDFSPNSAQLLVAGGVPSRNGEVSIFDLSDSKLILSLPQAHDDVIHSARFSPDGQRIATAGADKYMRTFDVASSEMLRRFEGHTNYILGLSWKGDGQTLVTASADNSIKVWDAETADQKRTIPNFGKHVTQVCFVGETDNIVSSCGDRIVRMHNSQNGGNIRTFNGADGWLHCVDVSADSTIVAAGTESGTVYVWNGLNGQPLKTIFIGPPSPHRPTPQ